MNTCQSIQQSLAAGEALSAAQREHVRDCPDCASFEQACRHTARVLHAGRAGRPEKAEISAVRAGVLQRTGTRPARLRLVWASCALVLGALAAVLVLSALPADDAGAAAGERLIALMDDVDAIATGSTDAAETVPDEEDLLVTEVLYQEQEDANDDSNGGLPGIYQVIEEDLEPHWL